jgi:hypothetical protein
MSDLTNQTLDLIKQAQLRGNDQIQKSITTANNLAAYDLQAPAKNLYPVQTPIRNTLPRTTGIGTATNWRVIRNILGSGLDGMGWVPEGQRSGRMSYQTQTLSASFKTLGEEDQASYESINAGRGFEDIRARMTMRLLQKLMLKEESAIIGGNNSVPLGTANTPVPSVGASGGTVAAATYYVAVVALTYEGYRNSSVSSTGVPTTATITGADGSTYTLSGGGSAISAISAGQAVTLGQTLRAYASPTNGAIAYAWYVGTTSAYGSLYLQAITTINSVEITAPIVTTSRQLASATGLSTDNSMNNLAFDGLLYQAFNPNAPTYTPPTTSNAGGGYIKTLATGTAGTGTPLTSSGRGSVEEIDDMLVTMWNNNQLSPTVIYCNAQEVRNISNKVLTGASGAPMVRYNVGENASSMQLAASPFVDTYFNPITKQPLRIEVHPNVPPGTILAWADDLPAQYQSSEVPNVAEIRARQDYYQIDWPVTSRQQAVGVYCEEVLVCYAPFAIGVINNIANG